jgi:hypothetical protein
MRELIFGTTNSGLGENGDGMNALIGKWENPLRMIIQNETDICAKTDNLAKTLYEMETSKHFAESYAGQSEFDIFAPVNEGGAAPKDSFKDEYEKTLKNHTWKKQFRVTMEAMDDSLSSLIKRKARAFVRSHFRTRNMYAHAMLIGATADKVTFGPAGHTRQFDATTADKLPLFSKEHEGGSNRYHTVLTGSTLEFALVKSILTAAVSHIRNMKDENGYALGYTANQIVIPANDPKLEETVKAVLGSEFGSGTGGMLTGEMNLHYGNWELVVDPLWQKTVASSHPFIVSSTAARQNLSGAVFQTRMPLFVTAHRGIDDDDYVWNGNSRYAAGFVSHKWTGLYEILDKGSTTLMDSGVAGEASSLLTL